MASADREQQFERALARLLRDASPESHCPDAEILAAYHERTLPPEQMTLWKEHISGCVFCQEVLALVEKSEDVPVEEWQEQEEQQGVAAYQTMAPAALRATAPEFAAERGPQRASVAGAREPTPIHAVVSRPRWRWIVPVGALAAGVIAWVGVREIKIQHKQEALSVEMARKQETMPSLIMPPAPQKSVPQQREKRESAVPTAEHSAEKSKKSAPSAAAAPAHQPSVAQNFSPATPPAAAAHGLAKPEVAGNDSRMAAPRVTIVGGSLDAGAQRQMDQQAPSPPAQEAKPNGQNQNVEVQPSAQSVTVQVQASPPLASERALVQPEARSAAKMNVVSMAATDHRLIHAPGLKHAWRVGDSGKIENSSDFGKTWKSQESGVTADLTAGSATSDKICWVVGNNGTILLTTDGGKHWKSISSPIPGDLGGIHASDAQHASVWDVAKHTSFETADGGATWTRSSNE